MFSLGDKTSLSRSVAPIPMKVLVVFVCMVALAAHVAFAELVGGEFGSIPKKIEGFKAVKVATGGYHTAIINEAGMVYQWGILTHGKVEKLDLPLQDDEKVRDISCGGYHCLALTSENRVFNWGRDAERDEGVGPVELSLAPLNGERVKLISAGYEHNLILTENGKTYTFGSGGSGQLGHGEKQEARQFDLKLVEALSDQNIVDGCAGGHHTIFLNDNGRVWSVGSGEFGQLGLGSTMARYIPTENTYFEASPAKAVSCGGDHTLVLLESGEVVGFGWNEKGPLGHNDSQNLLFPRKINVKNVTQTAGGGYAHSLFLLDDGSVVALGWCESGQCGVDDLAMTHITIPTKIRKLSNIKQIAGGGYKHSAVLHDNGDIFVMGSDDFGQCGPVVESVEEDKSLAGVFVFSEEGEGTSMQLPTTYLACGTDSSSKWEVGIAITQGLRESQEDYIVYVNETNPASADKSSFIAVYDGHGGSAVSGFLSRHLHKNYVAELATHTVPATAFASAYSKTDAYLAEKDLPFTGSTSVTCHLTNSDHDGTTAHCANAGDSYAVLATKLKGSKTDAWSFRKLSEDHRPTNRLETIRIESLGGKVVNGRVSGALAVSRAFGDFFFKQPAPLVTSQPYTITTHINTERDDSILILGSDGLWDHITYSDIAAVLDQQSSVDVQLTAEQLKELALKQKSTDNISVAVVKFT